MIAGLLFAMLVALTGDSLTLGYDDYYRDADIRTVTVASGGCCTGRYLGREPTGEEYIDYVDAALSFEPDSVVVMLGTNDAFRCVGLPAWIDTYKEDMQAIVDRYSASGVRLYVVTPPPICGEFPNAHPNAAAASVILEEDIVPWLVAELDGDFVLVDAWTDIQNLANWKTLYGSDGVHLLPSGYSWLAKEISASSSELLRAPTRR